MLYAIAIGILIVIAVVGTSKQMSYQSSAPLYKMTLYLVSTSLQKLNLWYNQERAYAIARGAFLASAFGGRMPKELNPVANATLCGGCKKGYDDKDGVCVNDNDASDTYIPTCYLDRNNKIIHVEDLPKQYYYILPEKKVVYWYYDKNISPTYDEYMESVKYYIKNIYTQPDPLMAVELSLLGVSFTDLKYDVILNDTKSKNNEYLIAHWIPIGKSYVIINYPPDKPTISYGFNLNVFNNVTLPLGNLYNTSQDFIKYLFVSINNFPDKFSPIMNIVPTFIDVKYVSSYTNPANGQTYYCNYTVDKELSKWGEAIASKQGCSTDKSKYPINKLNDLDVLYEYLVTHYSYDSSCLNICKNGINELSDNNNKCTVEINSTIDKNGKVHLSILKYSNDCSDKKKCVMCVVVSYMQQKLNKIDMSPLDAPLPYRPHAPHNWSYIKMVPMGVFNLTLESSSTTSATESGTYRRNFTIDYCYSDVKNDQITLNSICIKNGFGKYTKIYKSSYVGCYAYSSDITKDAEVKSSDYNYYLWKIKCSDGSTKEMPADVSVKFNDSVDVKFNNKDLPNEIADEITQKEKDWFNIFCYEKHNQTYGGVDLAYADSSKKINEIDLESSDAPGCKYHISQINCGGTIVDVSSMNWSVSFKSGSSCKDNEKCDINKIYTPRVGVLNAFCYYKGYGNAKWIKASSSSVDCKTYSFTPKTEDSSGGLIVKGVKCGDTWEDLQNNYYIGGDLYPKDLIEIYQPKGFVDQEGIIKRICSNPQYYYVNKIDNTKTYLLIDPGKEEGNPQYGDVSQTIVTCEMS